MKGITNFPILLAYLFLHFVNAEGYVALEVPLIEDSFSIGFYPSWSLSEEDCFISKCKDDQNVNFYFNEAYNGLNVDACDFADGLVLLDTDQPAFVASNFSISFNLASFFKLFYGSNNCNDELLNLVNEAARTFGSHLNQKLKVSVIELPPPVDLSHFGCKSQPTECDGITRVNFVIPGWCESTCAIDTTCKDRDYGISKAHLDFIITRFEIKNLLHHWNTYLEKVNRELEIMGANWESNLDWKGITEIHTETNECLYGGFTGANPERINSLDWALTFITNELGHQKKSHDEYME